MEQQIQYQPKDVKLYTEDEKQKAWREGYDLGMKNAIRENSKEIEIGRAILNVLDNRYEFSREID